MRVLSVKSDNLSAGEQFGEQGLDEYAANFRKKQ